MRYQIRQQLLHMRNGLNQWGFENPNQLCHAIVASQFPKQQRGEQVERLLDRIRDKGIKDPLAGVVSPTFCKSAELEDFKLHLHNRYEIEMSARMIFNYYRRYVDIFYKTNSAKGQLWSCQVIYL